MGEIQHFNDDIYSGLIKVLLFSTIPFREGAHGPVELEAGQPDWSAVAMIQSAVSPAALLQCNQTIKIKLSEWPDWNILFYFRPSYYKLGLDADVVRLKWMSVVSN